MMQSCSLKSNGKKAKEKDQDAKKDAKGKALVSKEVNTICTHHDDGDVLYASTLQDDFLVALDDGYHQDWVIDSGTSFHVILHKEWFHSYDASRRGCIKLGNDYVCDIVGVGDIHLYFANGSAFVLHNVKHF